jgi:hypothetical protein
MALAILPWLVAAGIPRIAAIDREAARTRNWTPLALALPCAALGLRLDVASGFDLKERLLVAAVSLVLALVLTVAARRAARSPAAHTRHAIAWLVLVPGLPLLVVTLREAGRPLLGEPIGALVAIANATPIAWLWREIVERSDALALVRVGGPLIACLALWFASAGTRERWDAR